MNKKFNDIYNLNEYARIYSNKRLHLMKRRRKYITSVVGCHTDVSKNTLKTSRFDE